MKKKDNNSKELMDRIYDTLLGNVGLSEFHVAFPTNEVKNQWVNSNLHYMYFEIGKKAYRLVIEEVKPEK